MPSASRLLGRTQGRSPEDAVAEGAPVLIGGEARNPDGVTPFPAVGAAGDAIRGTYSLNGVPYACLMDRQGLFAADVGTENLVAPAALSGVGVVGRATAAAPTLGNGDYSALSFDLAGNLRTTGNGGAGASTGTATAVSVTAAGVVIVAANANRVSLTLYNNGANAIFIQSGAAATTAAGLPIPPGSTITITSTQAINGIVAAGAEEIRAYEETV